MAASTDRTSANPLPARRFTPAVLAGMVGVGLMDR